MNSTEDESITVLDLIGNGFIAFNAVGVPFYISIIIWCSYMNA